MKSLFLYTVLLLVSFAVPAACPTQETTLFFINGVNNNVRDVNKSKEKLKVELLGVGVVEECVSFEVAHNTNEPLSLDFLEAGLQIMGEHEQEIQKYWKFIFGILDVVTNAEVIPPLNDLVERQFRDVDAIVRAGKFILGNQLAEHMSMYREALASGRRVILLGHSHGSLYANEAWDAMNTAEQSGTKIITVATPSDRVGGAVGPYTTLSTDLLAATVFVSLGALPPNVQGTTGCESEAVCPDLIPWVAHGFKEAYLHDVNARQKILHDIVAALPENTSEALIQGQIANDADQSTITVTLYDHANNIRSTTLAGTDGSYELVSSQCVGCAIEATTFLVLVIEKKWI